MRLSQLADKIDLNKNNPAILDELAREIAADFSRLSEEYISLKKNKANEWILIKTTKDRKEIRSKYLSDALTDQIWATTPAGQREIELKNILKAYEKVLSTIKSHLITLNFEARNNY